MNLASRLIFSIIALFFISTASAATLNDTECPPTALVSTLLFINASQQLDRWALTGYLVFNFKIWSGTFLVKLPGVTSKEQALRRGQDLFYKLTLSKPRPSDDIFPVCFYLNSLDYTVLTFKMN